MSVLYLHVDYEAYKSAEEQMRAFGETTTAFNRFGMCLIGINDRRDQPKDAHAAVLAAYDKVIASLS